MKQLNPLSNPDTTRLLMASIFVGLLNITKGDPGLLLIAGLMVFSFVYSDRLYRLTQLPKKYALVLIALISIPGAFIFQQLNSPALAIFFGGFKTFLNSTLGAFIPGSAPFFDIFVALLQFLFVLYMVLKGLKAFRERDNDEEFASIIKVPVMSLIVLSVFDFVLNQVISGTV